MNLISFVSNFLSQRDRIWLLLVLSLAAFCLYLPSDNACAMAITLDSSEYAICLVNLLEHGKFGFTLNGNLFPSHYTPWFSLSCLTPAYLLSGGNPLCFHWAILVFSLAVLVLMVKWGERIGMGRWSIVPAILLLFLPDFAFYSRIVMTEIPYVAIFAASALVWLRFVEKGSGISLKFCLGAGALVAWGGMIRPTMLPMLALFAAVVWMRFPWRERIMRWVVLVIPSTIYEVANLVYNKIVFGSFSRSGYQYWVPVPCDFPNLLFNWGNVCQNAKALLGMPGSLVVQLTVVMMLVSFVFAILFFRGYLGGRTKNKVFLLLLGYLAFQLCVLLALYGGFYWTDSRFYLSVAVCVIPLFLYSCQSLISRLSFRLSSLFFLSIVFLLGKNFLEASPMYAIQPHWNQIRLVKGRIACQILPENSVVTQFGNPNVLEHLVFKQHQLTYFPYGRLGDYENYMFAPVSIRDRYTPTSVNQIYVPELIEQGICKTPFPKTLSGNPEQVLKYLSEGKRVFIEQGVIGGKEDWKFFQKKLREFGLTTKYFGEKTVPAINPNLVRHLYDAFVLSDCLMDSRPEVSAVYHEIVRLEDASR